jgi:ketosteroid isomerase-like protein
MRKVNFVALTAVCVCLLASPFALGQGAAKKNGKTSGKGNVEETIKALSEQLNQAALKADAATYDRLVSDDYTSIGIFGTVTTKADLLANYKSGKLKFESIDVLDTKVRVYGDTALFSATANVKGHSGDTDISGQYRSTRVWIKPQGAVAERFLPGHSGCTAAMKMAAVQTACLFS